MQKSEFQLSHLLSSKLSQWASGRETVVLVSRHCILVSSLQRQSNATKLQRTNVLVNSACSLPNKREDKSKQNIQDETNDKVLKARRSKFWKCGNMQSTSFLTYIVHTTMSRLLSRVCRVIQSYIICVQVKLGTEQINCERFASFATYNQLKGALYARSNFVYTYFLRNRPGTKSSLYRSTKQLHAVQLFTLRLQVLE